jgi:hypothetical protein
MTARDRQAFAGLCTSAERNRRSLQQETLSQLDQRKRLQGVSA